MSKVIEILCLLFFTLVTFWTTVVKADDIPTILTCTVNAHANRDFGYSEKAWMGTIPDWGKKPNTSQPFNIVTKDERKDVIFRDKVFTGLNTSNPIVRSVTPTTKYAEEEAVEFKATVVSRFGNTVFLMWDNHGNGNKVWLAAVDLTHKKVTLLSQVFQGITSIGVEAETFDCK